MPGESLEEGARGVDATLPKTCQKRTRDEVNQAVNMMEEPPVDIVTRSGDG